MHFKVHRFLHVVGPAHHLKRSSYIQQQETGRNDDKTSIRRICRLPLASFPREYRKRDPVSSDLRFRWPATWPIFTQLLLARNKAVSARTR